MDIEKLLKLHCDLLAMSATNQLRFHKGQSEAYTEGDFDAIIKEVYEAEKKDEEDKQKNAEFRIVQCFL